MELYVHTKESEEPTLVVISEDVLLEALVREHGGDGAAAWREGGDQELDLTLTIRDLEIDDRSHLHVGRCKRVTVTVRQDTEKVKEFPPSATVTAVYEWASGPQGFDLLPAERVKHTFVICGTETEPDRSAHVGSYANDECEVCFSLVPKQRTEG
jgi:hypothetical protein